MCRRELSGNDARAHVSLERRRRVLLWMLQTREAGDNVDVRKSERKGL